MYLQGNITKTWSNFPICYAVLPVEIAKIKIQFKKQCYNVINFLCNIVNCEYCFGFKLNQK